VTGVPFNLGDTISQAVALHQQGRLEEADKLYRRVLKADRGHFDALNLLGALSTSRGRPGEACELLTSALKIRPRSSDALSNLAVALHALRRHDEALAALDKALAGTPGHTDALNSRGIILLDCGRPAEALGVFDAVLAANPSHFQARMNRGNALGALNRNEEALVDYDAVLAVVPGHPIAHYNRGNALQALGRPAEAIADYDRALAAAPSHLQSFVNRGLALAALGRHQEALSCYAQARALDPNYADVHFNASLSLLALGDYRRGFAEYEWRWTRTGMVIRKEIQQPLWLGDAPLAGKTLLLHAEQGLGDTVMFARFVPRLAPAGATIILEVPPELRALLDGLSGVSTILARGEPLPRHDLQCPLASLPLALKIEPAGIPAAPYLRVPDDRAAKWRARLAAVPGPRVALAWSGSLANTNDRRRSLSLSQLEPILSVPGAHFVSVQRDLRDADAERLRSDSRIVHLGGELADFADTAAVLTLVDLVICVDTSVAHVAGALGRPGLVLLQFQPDWRWLLARDDCPWYPTLRLFRQPSLGGWAGAITSAREALVRFLARA
jgi:tetratricopeptide (TPR) repeat protein